MNSTELLNEIKNQLELLKHKGYDKNSFKSGYLLGYAKALQLQQTGVMARCFKNYKGQFFIYKSRITKSETKFKVARNFESQGRTVLVSENDNKYYLHEVDPYNEP